MTQLSIVSRRDSYSDSELSYSENRRPRDCRVVAGAVCSRRSGRICIINADVNRSYSRFDPCCLLRVEVTAYFVPSSSIEVRGGSGIDGLLGRRRICFYPANAGLDETNAGTGRYLPRQTKGPKGLRCERNRSRGGVRRDASSGQFSWERTVRWFTTKLRRLLVP